VQISAYVIEIKENLTIEVTKKEKKRKLMIDLKKERAT